MRLSAKYSGQYLFFLSPVIFCCIVTCDRPEADLVNLPVPKVTAAPAGGLTTTPITFDCSQSLAGNKQDKLYFRWDWNNDDAWDTEFSAGPVFVHRFLSKGVHQPVLEVLGSSGLTDTCRLNIIIGQGFSAPRAMFRIAPETGNRLTGFVFDASFSKDDEDSLNLLQFRWDWEGDGRWDTGFGPFSVVSHYYYETGSFVPLLEVKDPGGLLSQYIVSLEVTQTNPRLFTHFNWSPPHPLQNDTVIFDASLSFNQDHPDDHLVYYWKFETGEPLKSDLWLGPFEYPTIARTFSMEIEYLVSLRIIDGSGLENQVARRIEIYHLNRPPLPRFRISSRNGNLTTQFLMDASTTTDAEDLPPALQVRWDFQGDGRWDTEFSLDKVLYHRFDVPGSYRILLEAMDTRGLTDTTSVFVTVTSGRNETGLVIDRRFESVEYYPTVKIGTQWWMARNMVFEPYGLSDKIDTLRSVCYGEGSWLPDGIMADCSKPGRLYTAYSAAAMNMSEGARGICPEGWHLPTKQEWETLITTIGGYSAALDLLPGGSSDFNALYAGWGEKLSRVNEGTTEIIWNFSGAGSMTYFWSSTPLKGQGAMSHWTLTLLKGNNNIFPGYAGNGNFMSVRCIKNE